MDEVNLLRRALAHMCAGMGSATPHGPGAASRATPRPPLQTASNPHVEHGQRRFGGKIPASRAAHTADATSRSSSASRRVGRSSLAGFLSFSRTLKWTSTVLDVPDAWQLISSPATPEAVA